MGTRLFVGNLPWSMSNETLEELFQQHGSVRHAKIIVDHDSGRSRGFGFVEMNTDDEARTAIQALDGQDYEGRALRVNEAKERARPAPRGDGASRGPRHQPRPAPEPEFRGPPGRMPPVSDDPAESAGAAKANFDGTRRRGKKRRPDHDDEFSDPLERGGAERRGGRRGGRRRGRGDDGDYY